MCKHIFTDCRHTKVNMRARKAIKITAIVLLVTLIFIILGGIFAIITLTNGTNLKNNDLNSITANLRVVSASGEEIEYYSRYKAEVSYQEISPYIVNAFVALEDKRFYKHHGLDYKRIAGAAVNNIKAGYLKEGGSTITQQLAKNAILSNEKSFVRKLKEAKLAIQIEKRYSKDEIMTMYLNTIYFGHSLYGVKAACARLFGKTPSEVNVAEAAMLAGIVKNPLKNSPLNSVENATERRNLVLKLMLEQGYIDESEYESALRAEYTAPPEQKSDTASGSYANAAIYEAATILGSSVKEVITGGYTVITYCDTQAQELLKRAYDAESISVDGADKMFLLGDNSTSGVCAYVSGISYAPHEFRRQPASTIKPIMAYAPAFDTGIYSPSSPIEDKLYDFNGYSPQNYQNSYLGWTTVRNAILTSSNACALKTVADLGLDRSMSYAKKFGINFDDKDGAASVLGGMTACTEILDQSPTNQLSSGTMWTTENSVDQGVIGVYYSLRNPFPGNQVIGVNARIGYYGFDAYGMGGQGEYGMQNLFTASVNPSNTVFLNIWQWCYNGVHRANAAIAGIPGAPINEEKKARLVW